MSGIFYVSYILLWFLCIVEGTLLLLVYRHFGLMQLGTAASTERDGLHTGSVVPPIISISPHNDPINWLPEQGRSYLVAFVSATCAPCMNILPVLYRLAATSKELEVLVVVAGQRDAALELLNAHTPPPSLYYIAEANSSVFHDYLVRVTPFAFVVGPDRRIHSKGLCDTSAKLQHMLSKAGIATSQQADTLSTLS